MRDWWKRGCGEEIETGTFRSIKLIQSTQYTRLKERQSHVHRGQTKKYPPKDKKDTTFPLHQLQPQSLCPPSLSLSLSVCLCPTASALQYLTWLTQTQHSVRNTHTHLDVCNVCHSVWTYISSIPELMPPRGGVSHTNPSSPLVLVTSIFFFLLYHVSGSLLLSPLTAGPLTSAIMTISLQFSSSLLITWQYHLNLASRILSVMHATPTPFWWPNSFSYLSVILQVSTAAFLLELFSLVTLLLSLYCPGFYSNHNTTIIINYHRSTMMSHRLEILGLLPVNGMKREAWLLRRTWLDTAPVNRDVKSCQKTHPGNRSRQHRLTVYT